MTLFRDQILYAAAVADDRGPTLEFIKSIGHKTSLQSSKSSFKKNVLKNGHKIFTQNCA